MAVGFNPKREARPSQTASFQRLSSTCMMFQSQTGSQALSDPACKYWLLRVSGVSIPNGKPGPLRPLYAADFEQQRDMFQSQTGSQALSDSNRKSFTCEALEVSIPNGKPGPLRPRCDRRGASGLR